MQALQRTGTEQKLLIATAICIFFLGACDQDVTPTHAIVQPAIGAPIEYRQYVLDLLPDLGSQASELATSVETFLGNPDNVNLETARAHWLRLHHTLVSLEAYCNRPETSDALKQLWFDLDAWPLEPGFIDSIPEYPNSGLINDLTLAMSEGALRSQHGATSPSEVSTGMHALEYLLWQRSLEEYQSRDQLSEAESESGLSVEQLSSNRRREMLRLIVTLLVKDLQTLQLIVTDSLSKEPDAEWLEPATVAQLDLLMVQRTLIEAQQNSTELHSIYSQSWVMDILTLLHQVSYLVDRQIDQTPSPRDNQVRQSLTDAMAYLSKLDITDQDQLSIALDTVAKLELQLGYLFGSKSD